MNDTCNVVRIDTFEVVDISLSKISINATILREKNRYLVRIFAL